MKYRFDIQILRGIAVLLVVLFHLGIESIASGFLGVDVFFVISGFLMAVLYKNGSAIDFLVRRAKRLLPAYYVVILCTLIISFLVNTPNESNQVVTQAIYSSTFMANIGFWLQNSYFSKSDYNPLLHLWSLGVEIQFYLLVPLLAYTFQKIRFSLIFSLLASITLCFAVLSISPKTSFFMMPLRVWEFLLGYGCAKYFTNNGNIFLQRHSWLGGIGLLFIILIPFFNVNGDALNAVNGHPGIISLLVSIATCAVLTFGLPTILKENAISITLIKLGKYSYSIYLVHFPVIVLYLSEPFSGTVLKITNGSDWFVIVTLIAILTYALHNLIETRKFNIGIVKLSAIFTSTTLALALFLPVVKESFITEQEIKIFNAFTDRSTYRCGKLIRIIDPKAITCELSSDPTDRKNAILLVGNSHADSIKTTFTKIAKQYEMTTHFIVQNNPLMKGGLGSSEIINEAKLKGINHIVVHFSPQGITADKLIELVTLSQENNIRVTFIDPVPVWPEHVPKAMYIQLNTSEEQLSQTKEEYMTTHESFFSKVNKINSPNFNRVTVVDYFCNPNCLYMNDAGIPLYFDRGHLTLTGSNLLTEAMKIAIGKP